MYMNFLNYTQTDKNIFLIVSSLAIAMTFIGNF